MAQKPFYAYKQFYFKQFRFSICTQFSSIWPIDRTLSGSTTSSQSGPGSNGNKGVLSISQISNITGSSPSDSLVSYPGHSLEGGSYSSAEKQSVYSIAPSDWAKQLPKLKIEMYRLQIGSWLWLAERISNGKAVKRGRGIEKEKNVICRPDADICSLVALIHFQHSICSSGNCLWLLANCKFRP